MERLASAVSPARDNENCKTKQASSSEDEKALLD